MNEYYIKLSIYINSGLGTIKTLILEKEAEDVATNVGNAKVLVGELGALSGNLLGEQWVCLGPVEFGAQVAQVKAHWDVVHPWPQLFIEELGEDGGCLENQRVAHQEALIALTVHKEEGVSVSLSMDFWCLPV